MSTLPSTLSASTAAACSASDFRFPSPLPATSPPTVTSATKSRSWSAPSSCTIRYAGDASPSACTASCSADFGFADISGSPRDENLSARTLKTTSRATSYPWSRNTAPITASSPADRFDGRSRPPPSSSPLPMCSISPSPISRAASARVPSCTSAARACVSFPSGQPRFASYSSSATAMPNTASPRYSNRSFDSEACPGFSFRYELWTSASRSSPASRNRNPNTSSNSPERAICTPFSPSKTAQSASRASVTEM